MQVYPEIEVQFNFQIIEMPSSQECFTVLCDRDSFIQFFLQIEIQTKMAECHLGIYAQ